MAPRLSTLREKLTRRESARKRQTRLWRTTRKAGHGRAAKRHSRAIRKLKDLIARVIAALPVPGTGAWGGSKSIVTREVIPVGKRYGAPVTSLKRAANHPLSLANPGSDHNAANTTAYAVDFGTIDGAPLGYAIAKKLGITGWSPGSYAGHLIERSGRTYRVQILWAVSGHYDHVHVGVKLS